MGEFAKFSRLRRTQYCWFQKVVTQNYTTQNVKIFAPAAQIKTCYISSVGVDLKIDHRTTSVLYPDRVCLKILPDRLNFIPGPQRSGYVSKFSNRPRTTPDRCPIKTGKNPDRSGPGMRSGFYPDRPSGGGPGFCPNGPVPDRSGPGMTPLVSTDTPRSTFPV